MVNGQIAQLCLYFRKNVNFLGFKVIGCSMGVGCVLVVQPFGDIPVVLMYCVTVFVVFANTCDSLSQVVFAICIELDAFGEIWVQTYF